MTLTNYWWLLIWLVTGGAFLAFCFPKKHEFILGKKEERWNVIPAIILVLPYILWAGFRTNGFGDTGAYRRGFLGAPSQLGQLPEYLTAITKDKGFFVLTALLKSIIGNSDVLYFLILAAFQMICLALVYRKYSCNYWVSIFIFVASTDYLSWVHNGVRQFLAITLIMAATPLLLKKKYIPLIAVILLAATFHGSALIMLPVVFIVQGKAWNKKTVLCIIACICALVFVDQFTDILDSALSNTQYSNMVTDWEEWQDDGTNPIRVLVYSIPMLLSIIGRKQIAAENNFMIDVMVNFSILTCGIGLISMGTSGIFIGRLISFSSVYSASILLPWEIEHIFTKESSRLILSALIIGYVAFFYYQMHFAWGVL